MNKIIGKVENPFESGHIKNYILLYVSIVVIMVLFFIAVTLFHDVKEVEKKVFNVTKEELSPKVTSSTQELETNERKFKLLDIKHNSL